MKKGSTYRPGQNKGGRPRIELDEINIGEAEDMAGFGATNEEIASRLGISLTVLEKRLNESIKKGRLKFLTSLRRLQARSAMGYWEERKDADGKIVERKYMPASWAMQIWLGKQYLNQKDRMEQDINQNLHEFKIEVMSQDVKDLIESGDFFTKELPEKEQKKLT